MDKLLNLQKPLNVLKILISSYYKSMESQLLKMLS